MEPLAYREREAHRDTRVPARSSGEGGRAHGPAKVLTRTGGSSRERAARRLTPEPRGKDTGENGVVQARREPGHLNAPCRSLPQGSAAGTGRATAERSAVPPLLAERPARGPALTCRCRPAGTARHFRVRGRAPRDTRAATVGRSGDTPSRGAGPEEPVPVRGVVVRGAWRALPEAGPRPQLPVPSAGPPRMRK